MEWRSHHFVKIVYVIRGSGRFEFDVDVADAEREAAREASPSKFASTDVVVVPPRTLNRIVDDEDAASSLYVCCIAEYLFAFDPSLVHRLGPGRLELTSSNTNRVASLLRRMRHVQRRDDADSPLEMVTGAMRLVQLCLQEPHRDQPVAVKADRPNREAVTNYIERLKTDFFEATTIDAAARELKMSRRTFTSMFNELTGETWLAYVRKLAVSHAQLLLASSDTSIAAIAFECGFNDLSTFYRQFKSVAGVSPSVYRRRL